MSVAAGPIHLLQARGWRVRVPYLLVYLERVEGVPQVFVARDVGGASKKQ